MTEKGIHPTEEMLAPPPAAYFASERPAAGSETVSLSLGTMRIEIAGLDPDRSSRLLQRFGPWATGGSIEAKSLAIRFALDDRDYFVPAPAGPEINRVLLANDGESIRFAGHRVAGIFPVSAGGRGVMLLARGDYETEMMGIENFLRAAVAWQALAMGGTLIHAASIAWRSRGFLFYGASGAGKSTLSACNRRGVVLSDDLSLVLPAGAGAKELLVHGTPFRGTYTGGPPVLGSFPLAAGFRLVKDMRARVEQVPRSVAFAGIIANLTFVVDSLAARPELFGRVERIFSSVPLLHLRFAKDDSFWDAIEQAGLCPAENM